MKTARIKAHRAGLMSNVNKVITCLRMYDEVEIDWSESIYGDCWDELFDYSEPLSLGYDTITDFPFYDLTAAMAGVLYQNEGWGWRQNFHPLWEKLRVKQPLVETAKTFIGDSTLVGALVRCDNHRGEQLSDRSQTYDDYAKAFDKQDCPLFLVTQDEETLAWFANRFPIVYFNDTKRVPTRADADRHLTVPQTADDAKQIMVETLALSMCKTLIHPVSNISTAALYINPNMKSIYLK